MVKKILAAAGIKERGSRFTKPPAGAYAVWFDDIDTESPDGMAPRIFKHSVTIELYAAKKEQSAAEALERELAADGLNWSKQDWYWISSEQIYQAIYEISYIEKRRM